jgi:hypothetical protein
MRPKRTQKSATSINLTKDNVVTLSFGTTIAYSGILIDNDKISDYVGLLLRALKNTSGTILPIVVTHYQIGFYVKRRFSHIAGCTTNEKV